MDMKLNENFKKDYFYIFQIYSLLATPFEIISVMPRYSNDKEER